MNILERIVADTREELVRRKADAPMHRLEQEPLYERKRLSFEKALEGDSLSVIAEVKKASPSKGVIRPDFHPVKIAEQYEEAGASALSVLTEPRHFQGSLEYLARIRAASSLPLLRKDFIVDVYQLVEARAFGADAVLLIAAVLDRQQLHDLLQASSGLGLSSLVEVYDLDELDRIDFDEVSILGVNNRDLRTFEVDVEHSLRVFSRVPPEILRVSESGLSSAAELTRLHAHGIDAVLIGETFMRHRNPGEALRQLLDELQVMS